MLKMEAVAEHPVINSGIDDIKTTETEELPTNVAESNVCHQSNGVDCTTNCDVVAETNYKNDNASENVSNEQLSEVCVNSESTDNSESNKLDNENDNSNLETCTDNNSNTNVITEESVDQSFTTDQVVCEVKEASIIPSDQVITETENIETVTEEVSVEISNDDTEVVNNNSMNEVEVNNQIQDQSSISKDLIEKEQPIQEEIEDKNNANEIELVSTEELCSSTTTINDGVHFETEILVEKNDNDIQEQVIIESETIITDNTNNILSELGGNIELSEVLHSSNVADTSENNNASTKEEVFNKEELLDILEGNDVDQSYNVVKSSLHLAAQVESEKAIKQLSMLKTPRRKRNKTKIKENEIVKDKSTSKENIEKENVTKVVKEKPISKEILSKAQEKDNIVNVLVMDWDDEEPSENNEKQAEKQSDKIECENQNQENVVGIDEPSGRSSVESTLSEDHSQKQVKSEDESPPKRLGRVIKKKVIFDPDNPDTFTKSKTPSKTKENLVNKEQPPVKKGKIEQTPQRMKSRSPTGKLQWKKPSPKNNKQNKRLSEVDKLLMDEGAVNMIYQLTPEAPKGRKNVKTKAEFIKKLQSSTPEGKEMKFRERKKDAKYEEGEAKKILSGKHRTSLSSSVKSPSVCEDFETHSADDSIIYRRHSSSSYSSSCMSPRRLSDVEGTSQNTKQSVPTEKQLTSNHDNSKSQSEDIFMGETTTVASDQATDVINKEDCLSIREKLNSKLSQALNKRKRDSTKADKPVKQKKMRSEEKEIVKNEISSEFKFVSINIDQHLAEISLQKTGLKDTIEVLKELENALKSIDENPDISVTLLSSQCGTLCSSLDLSLLLDENVETRAKNAYELAESVRSVLAALGTHRKLACCGVWGACSGASVALVGLCDVALASECATFSLAAASAPLLPGAAALSAPYRALSQTLVNDLVIFGRRISASEALQGGLVSRTLWPDRFDDQVRNIVRDIAARPMHGVLLKKRLLDLKKSGEALASFLSSLEAERNMLVEYWTSVEGQELLRAALDAA